MRTVVLLALHGLIMAAELPVATNLCELASRPDAYRDRIVGVRAEVVVGFEVQALSDPACPRQQLWFELDPAAPASAYSALRPALKGNALSSRRLTATLIGRYDSGKCFGHQCFSRSQLLVQSARNANVVERRLAPDFTEYDCEVLQRGLTVSLQKGHMDNAFGPPPVVRSLEVLLLSPEDEPMWEQARPVFQIALSSKKVRVLEARSGLVRLDTLAAGAYVFTAVAAGFQSVTGCFVIHSQAVGSSRFRVKLPRGV